MGIGLGLADAGPAAAPPLRCFCKFDDGEALWSFAVFGMTDFGEIPDEGSSAAELASLGDDSDGERMKWMISSETRCHAEMVSM